MLFGGGLLFKGAAFPSFPSFFFWIDTYLRRGSLYSGELLIEALPYIKLLKFLVTPSEFIKSIALSVAYKIGLFLVLVLDYF